MIIQDPVFLILIPLSMVLLFYYAFRRRRVSAIQFSSEQFLRVGRKTIRTVCYEYLWIIRLLVLIFFALALSRFRMPDEESKIQTEGIDIILVLDVSTSMLAEDFTLRGKRVNRFDVVKDVVDTFISGRKNDRIGIVVFASQAHTICPLTLDYGWLIMNLKRVKIGMTEDGTAIGAGLITALKRIESTRAKSKVVILLTDGINNAGAVSPSLAAEAAKALKIKVYTIGVGTKGMAPYPMKDFFGTTVYQPVKIEIDEEVLRDIASRTGGKYYRATDTQSLREIYAEIDRMEKSPVEEKGYLQYHELFPIFVCIGLAFLILEIVLRNTIAQTIP